ncbi:hypothetical protein MMC14_002472 [Varicellaria rhodocarpa]|nr:hypothetical protein [Varicellaria rhodocarpa]
MDWMKDGFVKDVVLDGRFKTISPLNHGSFGMVFLAKDMTTQDLVAIKCLTKTVVTDTSPALTGCDHLLELSCHNRLGHHRNIVNLHHAFETDSHMYLVLEFCSMGDLYEAIRHGRGPLQTDHVRAFMIQLVDAVSYMHDNGLYHRDIKPENIFLAQDGSMKLGDFGLSTTETWTYECSVGSDRYMAPEQYDPADTGYSPAKADIWAIGICLLNILFSRNPFVTPSESDVLFTDFVMDKQSLFDVFPNMSQDTFEVIIHAMAINPKKRSLSAVRDALQRVLSFTTDDEVYDDFCTEEKEIVPASANRQPLRTPSIQSPPVEQEGAFPWSRALHMSPPRTARQLSAIPDIESYSEDLYATDKDQSSFYSNSIETPSLASVLDSAFGVSVNSMNFRVPEPRGQPQTERTPISGSLPITTSKPVSAMSIAFGGKDDGVSKSWSDLYDEDLEDEDDARRAFNDLNFSQESIDEDTTIHRSKSTKAQNESFVQISGVGSHYGNFNSLTDELNKENEGTLTAVPTAMPKLRSPPSYSPPSKRSIIDKWAALGNRRRGFTNESKENKSNDRKRALTSGSWRRGLSLKASSGNVGAGVSAFAGALWDRKDKEKVKDTTAVVEKGFKLKDWRQGENSPHQHRYGAKTRESLVLNDDGDLEWVGGQPLQL